MSKPTIICSSVLLLLICLSTVTAQDQPGPPARSSPDVTVTAAATGERVRFAAPSSIVQIRLEVYSSFGKKLFDNESRGGNVLDWRLQDGQAEALSDGTYLCVVTVKSLSGKIVQRIGSVTIEKTGVSLQATEASQMTSQQAESIGPLEENASLLVLKEDERQTPTVIAHNGEDGQITRGRGALSFRIGDFFTGKDTEQMRLTEEGNLGIGITHPQARLDVEGLIRTSRGIVFPDGSIQTTAALATSSTPSGGDGIKKANPPGLGSLATTNGKSGKRGKGEKVSPELFVNEDLTVNGNIIFTPGLSRDITIQDNNGGIRIFASPTLTGSPASAAIQFFGNGHPFSGQAYIDSGAHNNAAVIFRTAITGETIAERMRITATGNVGIGTPIPANKLDVNGGIRAFFNSSTGVVAETSGGTNAWARFHMNTPSQRWFMGTSNNFNGNQFYLVDDTNGQTRMTIQPAGGTIAFPLGNFGIGAATPAHRLSIGDGPLWTSNFWKGALEMTNASAIGWKPNASSGQSFGIGQSNGGLYFFRTISAPGSTLTEAVYDMRITDNGNITQGRDKSGFIKALIYVDPFLPASQYIVNCYNGWTDSSTGTCGFKVFRDNTGNYRVNFGFQIRDRFFSLTSSDFGINGALTVLDPSFSVNEIAVTMTNGAGFADARFYVIVY